LEEASSSVFTIKMEEPTASNFLVEKHVIINLHQCTLCHIQDNSSFYRHCYEKFKYHSKAKNATTVSSSAHKIAS